MRSTISALVLVVGATSPVAAQSEEDFPLLSRSLAVAAIQKQIGCPVDVLVLSVEADDPDERPDSRTVTFRLAGRSPVRLDVRFEWEWQFPEDGNTDWQEPPGAWRVASVAREAREREAGAIRRERKAVDDVRTIAVAVEAYAIDHDVYPLSGAGLWRRLVPTYLRRFPAKDPWGNPYRYETGTERNHYVLSTTGEDTFSRLPEWYFRQVAETGLEAPGLLQRPGPSEIVFSDGAFLVSPIPEGPGGSAFLPNASPCVPPLAAANAEPVD
ncbi:MAG TPA: type II secretion system protein GspG [Thermoanaerobaculia bacterium]|nr:type II secretion system protein GspG [Thermoanaerobaculia bacterium]